MHFQCNTDKQSSVTERDIMQRLEEENSSLKQKLCDLKDRNRVLEEVLSTVL